jgi:hypothetical protein
MTLLEFIEKVESCPDESFSTNRYGGADSQRCCLFAVLRYHFDVEYDEEDGNGIPIVQATTINQKISTMELELGYGEIIQAVDSSPEYTQPKAVILERLRRLDTNREEVLTTRPPETTSF